MTLYLITYDLRQPGRNYTSLYSLLGQWNASRLLESVWLVSMNGTAEAVRDALRAHVDSNDGIAVLELKTGSAWAYVNVQAPGANWLQRHIP